MFDHPTNLQTILSTTTFLTLPGIYDCLSAKMAQLAGFQALFFSGGSFSLANMGYPDIGFYNCTESLLAVEKIIELTNLPVIVDIDNGFGNAIHSAAFAQRLQTIGAAGIQIDDQELPQAIPSNSKCSIDWTYVAPKIEAIREKVDQHFFILFRTVRNITHNLDEAIQRINVAKELGCDMAYVDGLKNMNEVEKLSNEAQIPLLINLNEKGFCSTIETKLLERLGYKVGLYPVSVLSAAAYSMRNVLATIHQQHTTVPLHDQMYPIAQLYNEFGLNSLTQHFSSFYPLSEE